MSVRIRMQRKGRKKRPFYRIVAADRRAPRDGRFIEMLGTYDPLQEPPVIKLDHDRIKHWLDNGATPSDTVRNLIRHVNDESAEGLEKMSQPKPKTKARAAEKAQAKEEAAAAPVEEAEAPAEEAAEETAEAAAETEEAPAEEASEGDAETTESDEADESKDDS